MFKKILNTSAKKGKNMPGQSNYYAAYFPITTKYIWRRNEWSRLVFVMLWNSWKSGRGWKKRLPRQRF